MVVSNRFPVKPIRRTAPTQSASDPDSKVNMMVLPPVKNSRDTPQASSPLPPAGGSIGANKASAPSGAHVQVPGRPSISVQKLWTLVGGSIALAVLAVGAILWIRTVPPGGDEALNAPRKAELAKANNSDPSTLSPSSVPKSSRNPRRTGPRASRPATARRARRRQSRKVTLPVSPKQTSPWRLGDCGCWCRLIFILSVTA